MSENKQHLIGWLSILLLFFVGIAVLVNIQRQQNLQKRASALPVDGRLAIAASSQDVGLNEEFSVEISFGSSENSTSGVDLFVYFDPQLVEPITIENGDLGVRCDANTLNSDIVFAPTESDTNCTFREAQIIESSKDPNSGHYGNLRFGIMPFNWQSSIDDSNYQPVPWSPSDINNVLTRITFRSIAVGNARIGIGPDCPAEELNCSTTDTNVVAYNPDADPVAEDILSVTNPSGGEIFINIADSQVSPTPEATATPTGEVTPTPTVCQTHQQGDANCDGYINTLDISIIINDYLMIVDPNYANEHDYSGFDSDINNDGLVNTTDLTISIQTFIEQQS